MIAGQFPARTGLVWLYRQTIGPSINPGSCVQNRMAFSLDCHSWASRFCADHNSDRERNRDLCQDRDHCWGHDPGWDRDPDHPG
jgi:hypothetical protein